ncbi:hypothetical protein PYCC9005_005156 [Savitreella phatthalungensis]
MSAFTNIGRPQGIPAFNHDRRGGNHADDAEYDRLRGLAASEANMRGRCIEASKAAYARGDGALAKAKSEEAASHGRQMQMHNEAAALYVFRANNAGCAADEIDLHGLHVDEAKVYVEQRVVACMSRGDNHLHIIVGKGIHSAGHIQKLKPAIEELCRQHNFQYRTEHNEGRIYVTFPQGGAQGYPAPGPQGVAGQGPYPPQQQYYPQQQQQQQGAGAGGANWQQYNTPQNRRLIMRFLRRIFNTCLR